MKRQEEKKHKLVLVDWLDAYVTQYDKMELENVEQHYTRSIGWEVKTDKEFLYISHFFDGISNELSSPYTSIPKRMIKNKYELEIID